MDSQNIKAFLSVVENRSFSKAADHLHLTQPAISKRVQALEQELGVPLFDRSQRKAVLSEAGVVFAEKAKRIMREMTNAENAVKNIGNTVQGSIKVICSHHAGLHRLPLVLKQYTQRYPQVSLELRFLESEKAYQEILKNQADLAFITIHQRTDSQLEEHLLWDDPMSLVCSGEHALAHSQDLKLEDLQYFEAILPAEGTYTYELISNLFAKAGLELKATMPTNYLETIKMMVSAGLGWSMLPNTMVDEHLHVLNLPETRVTRHIGAVSYKSRITSNAALALIEAAKEVWGER
ncbi:transcriptional regulator [Oleiphilus messinensis]|uniref:Transcriptional regulator n=1 Tax=Oleiphilus messinensis TaxID=141451 RepID=A0A1Y0I9W9_9GAMM|nr:LysR family transcriptional regulator [Oleiphilus messinensis]ARU57322.1 transcriptional regulator [Oleiphilus messinensis]